MKNKITKTITCLLAGLTLSACAGAGETATTGEAGEAITADDLEAAETPLSTNGVGYNFGRTSTESWSGGCLGFCTAFYPDVVDIAPLADNTGTANYSGSIHLTYVSNAGIFSNPRIVTDATFKVNFDENEILYDGTISNFSLKVRADFTPRGLITGTLSLDRNDSYLLGVIGQTEMAGSFTTHRNSDVNFAGGFTASRD